MCYACRAVDMEPASVMPCILCNRDFCLPPPPPWGGRSAVFFRWLKETIDWLLSWQSFLLYLPASIHSFYCSTLSLAVRLEHTYALSGMCRARFRHRCRVFYAHYLCSLTGFLRLHFYQPTHHVSDALPDGLLCGFTSLHGLASQSCGGSGLCDGGSTSDTLELLLELL
ncbi:E4 ORFE [Murine mastadenovirus A]|uniref:E4 ORFE n=1 Tax=Murine mastadenovirus A TaxID=129956 RepID=UPI00001D96CA|nr:E4 ORFE [Murine mastadenovirus A]